MKLHILLLLLSINSFAGEIYFQGPCHKEAFLRAKIPATIETVGEATINILNESNTTYIGSIEGMNSIAGTPTGVEAIEVLSNTHMRAYGWCYEVDGFQPIKMPNKIKLLGKESIRWFFAYSTYRDGKWMDYCIPSYELRSNFLCNK